MGNEGKPNQYLLSKKEKIVQRYYHGERQIGRIVQVEEANLDLDALANKGETNTTVRKYRQFQADIADFDALELVRELSPRDKIHMRDNAHGLYRLLKHVGLEPDDYIDEYDLKMYVQDQGIQSMTELHAQDHTAYRLVRRKDLGKKLFDDEEEE